MRNKLAQHSKLIIISSIIFHSIVFLAVKKAHNLQLRQESALLEKLLDPNIDDLRIYSEQTSLSSLSDGSLNFPNSNNQLASWAKNFSFEDYENGKVVVYDVPKGDLSKLDPRNWDSSTPRKTPLLLPENFNTFDRTKKFHSQDFSYLKNTPKLCAYDEYIDLVVLVAGATWEFERRNILRKTWAGTILKSMQENTKFQYDTKVKLSFYTGNSQLEPAEIPKNVVEELNLKNETDAFGPGLPPKSYGEQVMDLLKEESDKYKDLIIENFAETYGNLTMKTLGQFKWAGIFCPNAKFVMHVDSDVFVEWLPIFEMIKQFKLISKKPNHYSSTFKKGWDANTPICLTKLYGHSKVKIGQGKYQSNLKNIDYNGTEYPAYCEGSAFLINRNLAFKIFQVSLYTPMMNLEDVHTMGILRNKLDIAEPMIIDKTKAVEICQHLSNAKFHKGIEYESEIVEEKLVEAWNRYRKYSYYDWLRV